MKRISLLSIVMLLVLAFAASVSADVTVSVNTLALGDVREGGDFDGAYEVDNTFTISNTFAQDVNITLSSDNINDVFNVVFEENNVKSDANGVLEFELAAGTTATVEVTATLEEINRKNDRVATQTGEGVQNMGNIDVKVFNGSDGTEITTEAESILLTYENSDEILKFDDGNTYATIGSEEYDIIDEVIESVKPGDEIELVITLENNFASNSNDADFKDVKIELDYDTKELDADHDDKKISSISEYSTKDVKFTITVPNDIASGSYDITVKEITADDEFGGEHVVPAFTFTIEVEREENEISILDTFLTQERIACGQDKATNLVVKIQNTGEDDEDGAAIRVQQSRLGIDLWVRDIEIESIESSSRNSKHDETFVLNLPEDSNPGTYFLTVTTYYSNNKVQSKVTDVPFEIEACVTEEPVVEEPDTTDIVPTPVEDNEPVVEEPDNEVTGEVVAPVEEAGQSPLYTSLLVLANVGLVVVIVGLGIKLFKRD
jgi:uncharacterized membrane protein